jgi:ubiquinone/menaquinone biosynthesis C-methylase UbiE
VDVAELYDSLAATWDAAAGPVYGPLARSLVRASPMELHGQFVLDLGSGTGALAQAAAAGGARVVAADSSFGMMARGTGRGWTAVGADALTVPFRASSFDAAMAGFVLNHLSPAVALAELARVVRPEGAIVASTWSAGRPDPVKVAIDTVLASWGWDPPGWYKTMKAEVEPISGDPCRLRSAAEEAGLVEVRAEVVDEDLGLRDSRAAVAYRLAMPHIAPWLAQLTEPSRSELARTLCIAAAPHVQGWRPSVIQLTARVRAHPR